MAKRQRPLRSGPGARALLMPRVSTSRQEKEGTSLQSQEKALMEYATQRGYTVYRVLPDTFTGTELDRPALNEARALVRAEEIDVLLIYAYDRFFRNETHQTIVIHEASEHGVAVEAVTEQLSDTPTGRMVRTMLGVVAEIEHEKILERTARGLRSRVEAGKLKTGSLPLYGYRWILVTNGSRETRDAYAIDEETSPTIRWVYGEAARGVTLRTIARQLNERGVPTPSQVLSSRGELGGRPLGTRWHRTIIARILENPAYKGELRAYRRRREDIYKKDKHTGRERFVSTHTQRSDEETIALPSSVCPPIIDAALWDAVQTRLMKNKQEAARNNRYIEASLLRAGHVFCGHCGSHAAAYHHKPTDQWKYRCQRTRAQVDGGSAKDPCPANGFTHVAAPIDQMVWQRIELLLSDEQDGPSLLEQALSYRQARRNQHEDEDAATLAAIDSLLENTSRRRDNAQRALDNALAKDYDAETVDAVMQRVNEANREIRKLEHERSRMLAIAQARHQMDNQAQLAIEQLRGMGERLRGADYQTKRRWLWLLGVKVFVYREGSYDDGNGNRWRLEFQWDGLNALVTARQQQDPNSGAQDNIVNDTSKSICQLPARRSTSAQTA